MSISGCLWTIYNNTLSVCDQHFSFPNDPFLIYNSTNRFRRPDLKQELIVRTTMASGDLNGSRTSLNSTLGDGASAAKTRPAPSDSLEPHVPTIRRLSISSNHSSLNHHQHHQQHALANSVCSGGGSTNGTAECNKHSSKHVDATQATAIKEAPATAATTVTTTTTTSTAAGHQSQNPIKRKLSLAFRYARRALRRKRSTTPHASLVRLNDR